MTKRKRMPVNALQSALSPESPDAVLDRIVVGRSGAVAGAHEGEPPEGWAMSSGMSGQRVRNWLEARRLRRADEIVRARAALSLLVGLSPWIPLALAALVGIHLALLRALAAAYGVSADRNLARGAVASFLATSAAFAAARAGGVVLQALPIPGWVSGVVCLGGAASVSTFVVGRVFLKHFEAGETLLSLDPTATRDYFRRARADTSNLDPRGS